MANNYGTVGATLLANGYQPIPIDPHSKRVSIAGWSTTEINEKTVANWQKTHARYGVGIRTAYTPAIDIDIKNEAASVAVETAIRALLSCEAPIRIGLPPKRLLLCRTDTPFRKIKREFTDTDGQLHAVEILGNGQQFVAFNIHPDTKKPYLWGLDDPTNLPASELPTIDSMLALRIIDAAEAALKKLGWRVVDGSSRVAPAVNTNDALGTFKPKLTITPEKIDAVLESIPNDHLLHYDTWAMVGMGLWHQFDGSREGYQKWVDWSSTGPKHNETEMPAKWKSFSSVGVTAPVTFASVLHLASTVASKASEEARRDLIDRLQHAPSALAIADIVKEIKNSNNIVGLHREDLINKLVKAYKRVGVDASKVAVKRELLVKNKGSSAITDLEIALADRVLAEHFDHGDQLLSVAGECWIYDAGVWRLADVEVIRLKVLRVLQTMKESSDPAYLKLLQATQEAKRDDRMLSLVNTVTDILLLQRAKDSHTDPLNLRASHYQPVVNCKNGELWIDKTGTIEFRDHFTGNFLTSQLACDYDPLADCPEFTKALERAFSKCDDPEAVISHWLEVMGLIIQPVRAEAMWVLMKGPGGNGKSFLMEVISRLIGSSAYAGSVSDLGGKNGINAHFTASLVGKLLFLDDDLKTGTVLPDDWLKKLSEPKLLTANPKYGRTFEFTSRAIAVILTNPWPSTGDVSVGMQRRAQVFEMTNVLDISERDPALAGHIVEHELPGVLNLLLSGLGRVLQRGHKLDPPQECLEARTHWLNAGNPTARFLHERVARETGSLVSLEVLYDAYKAWVYDSDDHVKMIGRNSFYQIIENAGYLTTRCAGGKKVRNVSLKK